MNVHVDEKPPETDAVLELGKGRDLSEHLILRTNKHRNCK